MDYDQGEKTVPVCASIRFARLWVVGGSYVFTELSSVGGAIL